MRRLVLLLLLGLALVIPNAWGQEETDEFGDDAQFDAAAAQSARSLLSQPPPAGASREQLIEFHQRQEQAARALGESDAQLELLRKLAELGRGLPQEPSLRVSLYYAELAAGNYVEAAGIRDALVQDRRTPRGARLTLYFAEAQHRASVGDLAGARKLFDAGRRIYERNDYTRAESLRLRHGARLEWARAALLKGEGKLDAAEAALRRALDLNTRERAIPEVQRPRDRALARRAGEGDRSRLTHELADVVARSGRPNEAELIIRDHLIALRGRAAAPQAQASSIKKLGDIAIVQGRFERALVLLERAIALLREGGRGERAPIMIRALRSRANALLGLRRWDQAAAQYDALEASTADERAAREVIGSGINRGLAYVMSGRADRALAILDRTFEHYAARLGAEHPETAEVLGVRGMALARLGRRDEAEDALRRAAGALSSDRESTGGTDAGRDIGLAPLRRRLILEACIGLLAQRHQASADPRQRAALADAAFRFADTARSSKVQEAVAASAARAAAEPPELAELVRRAEDARREIDALYGFVFRDLGLRAAQQLNGVVADMRARIELLETQRAALTREIAERFPAYAALVHPKPPGMADIAGQLAPGEVFVAILSGEQQTYVWAVARDGTPHSPHFSHFHVAPVGEAQLAARVAQLRGALQIGELPLSRLPAFDVDTAHRLYADLLAPLEDALSGHDELVISASGALGQLPFALLVRAPPATPPAAAAGSPRFAEYRDVQWLVTTHALSHVPSASAFLALRRAPPFVRERKAFIGFGDPQFAPGASHAPRTRGSALRSLAAGGAAQGGEPIGADGPWTGLTYPKLPPLPETREEILAIATALGADPRHDTFFGARASRRQARSADLAQRRIVAFATHGLVAGDLPGLDEPALALAGADASESPLLTLTDVLGLKLNADWVVLSACNTAAAAGAGAEAVSGLGRAFFYAGSRALLVTHWAVETESAKQLVALTFKHYAAGGLSRAQALRRAQMELMRVRLPGRTEISFAHPLFWAAYALVGDSGR